MKKLLFLSIIASLLLSNCIQQPNSYSELPPGPWRVFLKITEPDQLENSIAETEQKITDYFELPFNMEVEYLDSKMEVYLRNGEEKIRINEVHYGRDKATAKDTILMEMSEFDTYFEGFYEENTMEGYWVVNYKEKYKIPFVATYGESHRFLKTKKETNHNLNGNWKMMFEYDNADAYPALAEFKQEGNDLTGTIRTETGDYRYLAGNVFEDKMRLSVFDGAHAFLFSGSIDVDTIYGEFRSGKHYKSKWYATRDNDFALTDPYEMTKAIDNDEINFQFSDTKGKTHSLLDQGNENKIKLINIMGTWCPNCKDEINYLKEIKKEYSSAPISIYTIAFERYKDPQKVNKILNTYKQALDFDWPLLYGGYANKKETGSKFPFLDKIYSYPTLLVVDKKNKIRYIHTGFNGPATSKYKDFKIDFENKLQAIIKE